MKKTLMILMAAAAMAACAQRETETTETAALGAPATESAPAIETAASTLTTDFATKVAAYGMMEIRLGQIAKQKAQASDVKDFATMIVTDHTKSDDELKAIASTKNLAVPAELPADKQQIVDRLSGLSGREFDREYMAAMVEDHEKAIEMFQQASNATDLDPELKTFVANSLPTLQEHLARAQTIAGSL